MDSKPMLPVELNGEGKPKKLRKVLFVGMSLALPYKDGSGCDSMDAQLYIEIKPGMSVNEVMKKIKAMYLDAVQIGNEHMSKKPGLFK